MSADHIGIALNGRRNGSGWLVCCPCPSHGRGRGDRSPSLSVKNGDEDRLVLHCFAGCDFLDILDELKHRGLLEGAGPQSRRTPQLRRPSKPEEPEPNPAALDIWAATVEPRNTFVQEYLERRGIPFLPQSIRCQADRPAMVSAVQAPDGKIIAVQQTWLTREGEKASVSPPRITTGSLGTGAVRLGAAASVMGLAEGVESALSAMQMTGVPVWASLGAARLHSVDLPTEVEVVHIFCDNDEPGRQAAQRAGEIHAGLGRAVHLRFPPSRCGDWNDYLNFHANRDGQAPLPMGGDLS